MEGLTDGALYRNTIKTVENAAKIIKMNEKGVERLKSPRRALCVSVPHSRSP